MGYVNNRLQPDELHVESDDAPITPNFPFISSREIAGDYVKT